MFCRHVQETEKCHSDPISSLSLSLSLPFRIPFSSLAQLSWQFHTIVDEWQVRRAKHEGENGEARNTVPAFYIWLIMDMANIVPAQDWSAFQ